MMLNNTLKHFGSVLMILLSTNLMAQAPNVEWEETIGTTGLDFLIDVIETDDNGYLAGGFTYGGVSGDKTEPLNGFVDYWIVKTDANGNIEWDRSYGGSSANALSTVLQTADGGYILGGSSSSNISGDKSEDSRGGNDYWIVKISSTGDVEWDKTFGGSLDDQVYDIIQTSDGGYLAAGSSNSGLTGDKTESGNGFIDFWIVKMDASGNYEWDRSIGGSNNDNPEKIVQTADGGYVIAGYSDSDISGDKSEANQGFFDYWAVKIDSSGVLEWDKTYGGNGGDVLRSISPTLDGGYILGGTSNSNASGTKSEDSFGGDDYWIVKISDSGSIIWDRTYGGNSGDFLYDVRETYDGSYFLAGYSSSNASDIKSEAPIGSSDYWVLKIGATGSRIWDNTIGGASGDLLFTAELTSDNAYIIGGYSSSDSSGDKSEDLIGGTDFWMAKLQPEPCGQPVNLQESDLTATSVTLSWDHVPTAIGYQLRFQNVTMGSGTKLRLEPPVSTISIGAAKIFPGNTYIWRIRARCADGFSDWSLNNTFTTPMRLAGDVTDVAIIYPNPSNGLFNIQLPELNGETNADIIVMDMMGRVVSLQQAVGGTTSQIELDVPGMYQLVIRSNQYSFTEQLIVQ